MVDRSQVKALILLLVFVSICGLGFIFGELKVFPVVVAAIGLLLYYAASSRGDHVEAEAGVISFGFLLSVFAGLVGNGLYAFSLGLMLVSLFLMLLKWAK